MGDQGIAERVTCCRESLSSLLTAAKEYRNLDETLSLRDAEQLRERFDQWAGNLGALQPASSALSLEHRLRNSPVVSDAVLKLLSDLLESLQSATDIATGRRSNRTAEPLIDSDIDLAEYGISSSDSDSDSSGSGGLARSCAQSTHATSEINELMSAIKSSIDSLFKTSIFIRKYPQKDRRQRASATRPFDNFADVMYIRDRYPLVASNNDALVARLGEANARRRQYFKYCRDHNNRLSRPILEGDSFGKPEPQIQPASQPAEPKGAPPRSTLSGRTKPSLLADTEATEFVGDTGDPQLPNFLDVQSGRSVVSFATTVAEMSKDNLAFPPLPSEAEDNATFLCPYCFTVIALNGKDKTHQWRKHILTDLEPYICTFPGCGLESYQSQHAWFEHELLVHRSVWVCSRCSESFKSPEALGQHIAVRHSQEFVEKQMAAIIETSRRRPESIQPSECPFCDGAWASTEPDVLSAEEAVVVVDIDQFRKHLGHHLRQIALFSLPRQNQEQEIGSNDVAAVLDRDTIPLGWKWERHDFGRGWSLVSSKKAKLVALAAFLDLHNLRQGYREFLSRSLFDVDVEDVPGALKKVERDWSIVCKSRDSFALSLNLAHSLQHATWINDMRFSIDGCYIAAACLGSIDISDVNTGLLHRALMLPGTKTTVEYCTVWFSPDGECIVSGDDKKMVIIWSVKTGEVVKMLAGHTGKVSSVCWASDGESIASCSAEPVDGTVRLWDAVTGECRFVLSAGTPVHPVATRISSKLDVVLAGGADGLVKTWRLSDGAFVPCRDGQNGHDGRITAMDISAEPSLLLTSGIDKTIRLWGLDSLPLRCSLRWLGHKTQVRSIVVIPNTLTFLSVADGCVTFWRHHSHDPVAVLRSERFKNIAAVHVPGSSHSTLATTDRRPGRVRLWTIPFFPESQV